MPVILASATRHIFLGWIIERESLQGRPRLRVDLAVSVRERRQPRARGNSAQVGARP